MTNIRKEQMLIANLELVSSMKYGWGMLRLASLDIALVVEAYRGR